MRGMRRATVINFVQLMRKRLFVSHISEERVAAERLKGALSRDFLGLLDVFVSSDTESIAAGEEWLSSIENALRDCSIFVTLCSPESIRRPWINFETGAAWMREIPVIPVCHSGLLPHDLPMPLSLKQGIALDDGEGLRRLYARVAKVLECDIPRQDFSSLANSMRFEHVPDSHQSEQAVRELDNDRATRNRLMEALSDPRHKWRSLERVAVEAALSEERAADLLRSDPEIRFGKGKSRNIIVGLRSRVDVKAPGMSRSPRQSTTNLLNGTIGTSRQWSSAWIDLDAPRDLKMGQRLILTLGGSPDPARRPAERVLVRLLRVGDNPSQKVGVITETGIDVPSNRRIEVEIPADYASVTQISVHGGRNAWDQFLGEANGPATLTRVELSS